MWIRASDSPSQTKTETRNRTRYRFRMFRWRYTHFVCVCVCAIWRALLYFINIYCEKDFHFRDNYDSISFLVLNEYCMRTVVWPYAINCGRVNVVYWYDKAEHLLLFHYSHYCSAFVAPIRFGAECMRARRTLSCCFEMLSIQYDTHNMGSEPSSFYVIPLSIY